MFDFKKVKNNILMRHLAFFVMTTDKPYQTEMNFTENKHLSGLLILCPGLLYVAVLHNLAV